MIEDTTSEQRRSALSNDKEQYSGGSAEAEYEEFQQLAQDIMAFRRRCASESAPACPTRSSARSTPRRPWRSTTPSCGLRDLPADLRVGFAQPGKAYRTIVRFSNAAGSGKPDFAPDLRGIALRIQVDDSTSHDLLATNFPVSHARNARQFVEFAKATAGGRISRLLGLARLAGLFGIPETVRMFATSNRAQTAGGQRRDPDVLEPRRVDVGAGAGRPLSAAPGARRAAGPKPSKTDPCYLSTEAARRLRQGDIRFELCIQRYVNDQVTPIEDTAVEWKEKHSPAEPVATLTIRQSDSPRPTPRPARQQSSTRLQPVEHHRGLPPAGQPQPRPQGRLRRQRSTPEPNPLADRNTLAQRVLGAVARGVFSVINRCIPWYRLPVRLAVLNLDAFRHVLRANLIDTEPPEAPPRARPVPPPIPEDVRVARTSDGRYNDLSAPEMGAVGAPFGRNLKPDYRPDLFNEPNPDHGQPAAAHP